MAQLNIGAIKDLGGIGGFTFSSGGITANGNLTVTDLVVDGNISGSSNYLIPNPSGNNQKYLGTNGSNLQWTELSIAAGVRSMQVWTSNGTWSRPSGVKTIMVTVTGAGGGGSGFQESGGAGGTSQRQVDVTNVSSVSVTVGNPGGGTNYSGCGGNGNSSSFGGYCSASGGYGANCRQQHSGGIGGNGSGGSLNVYGGGGGGHGSHYSYGNHHAGTSYWGGSQPSSHGQSNYAHRHQSHAAWGAGGNGAQHGNRGARGREGVVVVHEFRG
jgi:hypothetical protein|tara:strand:+ start:613 stop:1422 length:810 start_codon:yes stop_codon:yes gene_type:complete